MLNGYGMRGPLCCELLFTVDCIPTALMCTFTSVKILVLCLHVEPPGAPDISRFHMVDMFTSITDPNVKECILSSFQNIDHHLRVVISTLAFGMGADCPNVGQVVHYGPPDDIESYIQET